MSSETLESDANYGCLPFDLFISEHWDHDAAEGSQEQWERLIWDWQKLTLLERWPYQNRAEISRDAKTSEISDEIRHVLATHQRVYERNISLVSSNGWQTVWLRTCYDLDLTSKYEELKWRSEVPGMGVTDNKILDDPTRYNFDDGTHGSDSWRQVLVYIPGITDFNGIIDMNGDGSDLQYKSGQNDEYMVAQAEEESEEVWRDLAQAELRIQAGLYLLDREAIESGLIKILWLDEHGNITWDNQLDPFRCRLDGLTSSLLSSISLVELANSTRGALIEN